MKENFNKDVFMQNVSELRGYQEKKLGKYRRNFRRYNFTPFASIENIRNPSVIGWFQGQNEVSKEQDTNMYPEINVVKSVIDTLTSKIAESKVRPFFNTINGSFKDQIIVRQIQQFFDQLFDWQDVNAKISNTFRDSAIFETGVVYINEKTADIVRALPWQVFTRPAEKTYGKLTRVYFERKHFPVSLLPDDLRDGIKTQLEPYEYITYGIYYDTFYHKKVTYILELSYYLEEDYSAPVLPFVFLHYCSPILGDSSESVVDMLNTIQLKIDRLMAQISDASELTPANTIIMPNVIGAGASQLNNRIGNVIRYTPTPNQTGDPFAVITPSFISDQYISTLEKLKQTAYELVGISQLSAMSQKPTGLNSGVALQSMENIESDRFETQLNQVVRAYVDVAKICIQVLPPDMDILPPDRNQKTIKWADVVKESNRMKIQSSGADALSKDPATKLQQLQTLASAGIIPQSHIAQFMEIPDLQSGYSMTNNAINATMTVIENCLDKDDFDIPEYIPFQMLKEEIINTQLSLYYADFEANENDIQKLNKLYETVEEKEKKWQEETNAINNAAANLQGQNAENALPAAENVLTQEANMQPAAIAEPDAGEQPGDWNAGA